MAKVYDTSDKRGKISVIRDEQKWTDVKIIFKKLANLNIYIYLRKYINTFTHYRDLFLIQSKYIVTVSAQITISR